MKTITIVIFLLASTLSYAQDGSFYAGVTAGHIEYKLHEPLAFNTSANILGLHAGYQFTEYLSLETEYLSTTDFDLSDFSIKRSLFSLSLLPSFPINENWETFARLGYGHTKSRTKGITGLEHSEYLNEYLVGIGLTRHFSSTYARVEIQRTRNNADIYSLGFGYKF